jgi:hypothetical protein
MSMAAAGWAATGAAADRSSTFSGVLASLAARGYVVASIDYRLSGEAVFPAQAQNVKAAIRWLRSRASDYGINPARAMTWGVSAGEHLAALAAVSCNVAALEPAQTIKSAAPDTRPDPISSDNVSDCVQGAVVWYGRSAQPVGYGTARRLSRTSTMDRKRPREKCEKRPLRVNHGFTA